MSQQFLGFAERVFSITPRPASLKVESLTSNLVLIDIIIQILLLGYILLDDFVCAPVTAVNTIVASEYVSQVCGTEVRTEAYWYYVQKIVFLSFFIAIFYLNKVLVNRINRYHTILMREKLPVFLSMEPIYKNVNYYQRWKGTMIIFFFYKIFCFFFLALLIVASLLIYHLIETVDQLLSFSGVECGREMKKVHDLDQKYICHFQHEFLIAVLSYITTVVAFLIWLSLGASLVGLIYYYLRFRREKSNTEHLDYELLPYVSKFE